MYKTPMPVSSVPRVPHIVIVGGGFGGLKLAKELKRAPVMITLVDKRNHHLFQPLLYQVATAGLSPADIAAPIRAVLKRQENVEVLLGKVTGVDVRRKEVWVGTRAIPFDYLVLATGSSHSYFGHSEWEAFAPGLKSIHDAVEIREKILSAFERAESEPNPEIRKELLTFAIVGGGPTGVELSGALYELSHISLSRNFRVINPRSTRIILLEAGPRILASFSPESSAKVTQKLEGFGIEVRTNSRVSQVDDEGIVIGGTERIRARTVLWAAGVAASPAASWVGAESDRAGRAKVQSDLSVQGHPEIFIIGDAATLIQDGKPLPGVAPVALQQGKYLARLIKKEIVGKTEREPFHYFDKGNLATVGRAYAIAEFTKLKVTGFIAWILWLAVHIYYLIGFRNRVSVMLEWAWAYLTYQRGARLITWESSPQPGISGGRISGLGSEGGTSSGRRGETSGDSVGEISG